MDAFSTAWMTAAAVSFFCERLVVAPFGLSGSMVVAVVAVLLPELLNRLIVLVCFQPDVTLVVDPCERDAQVIARGIRQAMRVCLAEGRQLRLLIARVPGRVMTIGLNAVRQRVFVTIGTEPEGAVETKSQSALPLFFPGEAATWYRLTGGGDNVRLCFRPSTGAEGVVCQAPALDWRIVAGVGFVLLAGVWFWSGAWVASVAVLPFVVIRTLTCFYVGPVCALRLNPFVVMVGSGCVILFNLIRMAMF